MSGRAHNNDVGDECKVGANGVAWCGYRVRVDQIGCRG